MPLSAHTLPLNGLSDLLHGLGRNCSHFLHGFLIRHKLLFDDLGGEAGYLFAQSF